MDDIRWQQYRTQDFKKGGGPETSEIWEQLRSFKFRPIFRPKLGEEQKKKKKKEKRSSLKFCPIFRPKSGEEQKKSLHSNFVPFFAQNH